jgi:hypothetical protein
MDTLHNLKKRYTIWRLIPYYGTVLVAPPLQPIWLLFLVAATDGVLSYVTYALVPVQLWARLLLPVAADVVGWVPVALFTVAADIAVLSGAAVPVTRRRPVTTTVAASAISFAALLILATIGAAFHGVWRVLFVVANYLVYGWFTTCILCALTGDTTRAAMRMAFGFMGKNGNKILIYLVLVILFHFLVVLATPRLVAAVLSPVTLEGFLFRILGLFLPPLLSPIVAVMFLKVTFFPDAPTPRSLS